MIIIYIISLYVAYQALVGIVDIIDLKKENGFGKSWKDIKDGFS